VAGIGFSRAALGFYAGIEEDNSTAYFAEHKDEYEREVREPAKALATALTDEFGPVKVSRANRDLRFDKGGAPYKTALTLMAGPAPGLGWYLRLDARGLVAGGGLRPHTSGEVARLRAAVDDDTTGRELLALVEQLRADGFSAEGAGTDRMPRGYPAEHPRAELLRWRAVMVVRDLGRPRWLATPALEQHVRTTWRAVRPVAEWAQRHVGVD
jgi:uncharacterized protein (TIGR02453 family)